MGIAVRRARPGHRSRNEMRSLPFFLLLALALALHSGAEGDPRMEILRLLNAERQRSGAPPLRLSPELTRAAQAHAAEIAARGSRKLRAGSTEEMRERLKRAGYQSHAWTEGLVSSSGDLASVLRDIRQGDPETWRKLLAPESRDWGSGVARLGRTPPSTLLVAEPEGAWFARGTAGIRDLGRVRAAVLGPVSGVPMQAGAPPLRANQRRGRRAQ